MNPIVPIVDDMSESATLLRQMTQHRYNAQWESHKPRCHEKSQKRCLMLFSVTGLVLSFGLGYFTAVQRCRLASSENTWSEDGIFAQVTPAAIRSFLESTNTRPFLATTESRLLDHSKGAPMQARPPSPEVDEFWVSHGHSHLFLITEMDVKRLGKDPSKLVRVPGNWGYNESVFLTRLDHMHQFHCLNWLRQLLHPEYYNKTSVVDFGHGDHCVRSLFDYLNCHSSYEVHNYVWMENRPRPWPDFVSRRECRSMKQLLDFDTAHSVDADARIMSLIPPENAYIHRQDKATQAFLDNVLLIDPNYPSLEEEISLRTEDFRAAMVRWEETGEIPQLKSLHPWQGA